MVGWSRPSPLTATTHSAIARVATCSVVRRVDSASVSITGKWSMHGTFSFFKMAMERCFRARASSDILASWLLMCCFRSAKSFERVVVVVVVALEFSFEQPHNTTPKQADARANQSRPRIIVDHQYAGDVFNNALICQ